MNKLLRANGCYLHVPPNIHCTGARATWRVCYHQCYSARPVNEWFAGLDQINVKLPRSLAGRGEVNLEMVVDGKVANVVRVVIR